MEPHWTVYCHIHIESGRRYVGLTKLTMMKRWNSHIYTANRVKNGKPTVTGHFPNAIRKYGKDAFSHEVLEICHDLESANLAEQKWIEHFKTRDPQFGFNLAPGGQHKPHPIRKNPWDDPEYRAKQAGNTERFKAFHSPEAVAKRKNNAQTLEFRVAASERSKEVLATPKIREKILQAGLFKRGKPLSPEHRAKIGIKSAARIISETTRKKLRSYVPSAEVRIKLSVSGKGRRKSQEERMKISAALKGRTFSEEHRKALSLATKNRDPSVVAKVSEKLRGRKLTEEQKAKISAAGKGRLMSDRTKSLLSERTKRQPVFTPDGRLVKRICGIHGMLAVEKCRVVNVNNPEKTRFLCKQCEKVKRARRRVKHRSLKP